MISTSSARTKETQTQVRKLRTFLSDLMEGSERSTDPPPICARIRELREERKARDKETARREHRKNKFTQEAFAHGVGVTLKAYSAYESFREPDYEKRKIIARLLELPEDYFEGQVSTTQELRDLRGELAEVREQNIRIEQKLDELLDQ